MPSFSAKDTLDIFQAAANKKKKENKLTALQEKQFKELSLALINAAVNGHDYCYHAPLEERLSEMLRAKRIKIMHLIPLSDEDNGTSNIYLAPPNREKYDLLSVKIADFEKGFLAKKAKVLYRCSNKKIYSPEEYSSYRYGRESEDSQVDNVVWRVPKSLNRLIAQRERLCEYVDENRVIGKISGVLCRLFWGGDCTKAPYNLQNNWEFNGSLLRSLCGEGVQSVIEAMGEFFKQEASEGKRNTTLQMRLESGYWWCLLLGKKKFYTLGDEGLRHNLTRRSHYKGLPPEQIERLLFYLGYQTQRADCVLSVKWA